MKNQLNPIQTKILSTLNLEAFNPMQLAVMEKGKGGDNLVILSPTGSGKTLAFLSLALHQMEKLEEDNSRVKTLIISPSRELASQIETVFRSLKTSLKVTCCYGGHSFKVEEQSLTEAPAVLIGTPGRILDHVSRKTTDLSKVDLVILDEYDKLLQMGFLDEMDEIFRVFKKKPQVILTSATAIDKSPSFIRARNCKTVDFSSDNKGNLKIYSVPTSSKEKVETLINLLAHFGEDLTLIFCNHVEAVIRLSDNFDKHQIEHGIFHGDLEQIYREKNLIKFRSGACNILIATDLAARGLDIPLIKNIVHYQMSPKSDEFTHRNGRTARMHAEGEAFVISTEDEPLPSFLGKIEEFKLNKKLENIVQPMFSSIYISAGKKDKISKADILGFLTQSGGLKGEDIGLISILDKSSYVAVERSKVRTFLKGLKDPRIKKQKVKIEGAN